MEVKAQCRFCDELICSEFQGKKWYRCRHGRFDQPEPLHPGQMIPRYFAWSGIWKLNKTVAAAQKDCPYFNVYPQTEIITKAGRK